MTTGERDAVRLHVAVDLVPLRPGGENGGIRTLIFELLGWLGRQTETPLRLTFLTNSHTHAEVRRELARLDDTVACVQMEMDGSPWPLTGREWMPRECLWPDPPADVARRLGATVLYCPFGAPDFATPGLPVVCTVVDVLHRDFPDTLPPSDRERRERFFQRLVARADRIQCNSLYVEQRMTRHYGLAPARMFHVYNAVHGRFAAGVNAPTAAASSSREPENPYFLYPANLWRHKNHETLLLGYQRYRTDVTGRGEAPWDLLLTGHGDEERGWELREMAGGLGLETSVRFAGYLAPSAFAGVWAGAGALVFPSLHEGFGIPLLEAMCHGVPVACSAECSLPEVGGDACLYVPEARDPAAWAAALGRLAGEPDLRRDLVARGRRRLEGFSLRREGGKLLAVLAELGRATVNPETDTGPGRPDRFPRCRDAAAVGPAGVARELLAARELGRTLDGETLGRLETSLFFP